MTEKAMTNKSSFRRLLELGDKEHRELLKGYFIISEERINNLLSCLETGAEEIKKLKEENKRLIAVNKELLEALKAIKKRTCQYGPFKSYFDMIALIAAKAVDKAEAKENEE
jgi:hypothetical protein